MKKVSKSLVCIALCLFLPLLAACRTGTAEAPSSAPQQTGELTTPPADESDTQNEGNILVVYFSYSSNTEKIATHIAEKTNADIVEIEAAVPYTAQDVNYSIPDMRPQVEHDTNARPEVATTTYDKIDLEKYSTVFVGYPIWWWTAPMIIGTFLEHYDWSGIHIYPFSQSASMNAEQFQTSVAFVRECASKNGTPLLHDGLFTKSNSAVDEYLEGIVFYTDSSPQKHLTRIFDNT